MARDGRTTRKTGAAWKAPRAAPLKASDERLKEGGKLRTAPKAGAGGKGSGARSQDDPVRVFISYAHADRIIAAALKEALTEANSNRVRCFLDTDSIGSGEDWPDVLRGALAEADWLVCVYTGEQSQFCGYEVGVFTQGKALAEPGTDSRLVCLHDVPDLPGLFAATQNRLIKFLPPGTMPAPEHATPAAWPADEVRFYRDSNIFRFLSDFCRYKDLYPVRDAEEGERQTQKLLAAAKRITLAFDKARGTDIVSDTPPRLKLEVSFGAASPAPVGAVPADARVAGTSASFALFGLRPRMTGEQLPFTAWADLKAACQRRSPANALWMDSLEREMLDTMQGLAVGAPEAVFSAASDGKLYRPILVRHVVRYDGTNQFDLVFIETLPRQFVGLSTTSLLLAGLVQASRFRFAFLEQRDRVAARFDDGRSDLEFATNCKQLRYDIERIESEAAELGVLDLDAFVAAFGPQRRAQAEGFIEQWNRAKAALLPQLPEPDAALTPDARAKARAAIAAFLAAMERENHSFVLAALDAYREEVAR